MSRINSTLHRTIQRMNRYPQEAHVLGKELRRSLMFNVRNGQQTRSRARPRHKRTDQRRKLVLRMYLACLQDPRTTKLNNLKKNDLLNTCIGLGKRNFFLHFCKE